ncbi:disease resistance protein RPV1-like [Rhododendron vialii]|uniref:disease resistance protein RPV1-like n=1 Tax=Rhododendron vialii TaxID=182163 RepID=UPI00265E7B9B|nr:disease resistance protein RPV1-like [Rhododendron vialii]
MAAITSQEASSSTSPCSYDVFLSFRGEDTRKSFTDHLYTALDHAGFRTFRDDDGIERGEKIKSELQKAIRESRMSIVVLSKNYASSSWCLDELVMILKCRSTSGHVVLPVFYDVDPSQVRKQMGSFEEAFTRHEGKVEAESGERSKEWMNKVEEWRAALREVADLAGMNLQNRADGHESRFIQKVIKEVGDKISHKILDIGPYAIGIHSRAREIQFWLEDESADVGIAAICGMGGIGKTTIAKFLYNLNFSRFQGSSFLANVREISKQQDGLLCLQRQLVSDILKGRKEKISNVDEGIVKIKDALHFKRVLVILDDVDKLEQLYAVLGMRDWLFPGSKIIITIRNEHLVRAHEGCKVHRIIELDYDESLELFSLHAFGQNHPIDDYADTSKLVVQHCGGLPLAIKVLGSSLFGKSIGVWKSQLEKLKAIPDSEIFEKLKISYDSLQDDHDKSLFLHLACFFIGSDKDCTITIMDGCEFYTVVGIQNLTDRCLVTIDGSNKVVMHHLLQEMGREIVRQESPNEPGERSRLCSHKDSFDVLRHNTGTRKIEGLILDMSLLKEDKSAKTVFGVNRKRSLEEFLDKSLLSNVGKSLKRYRLGIFSQNSLGIAPANSNQIALETKAFAKMENLKLLKLGHVQISGSYENFPKKIRWLCWHGFPFESITKYFPLEALVALEMPYSNLKHFLAGTKFLELLKILNLSHSHSLAKTPNFIVLPNLERLILEDCTSLVEIHESVGDLARLVLLNLKDCCNLRKLPRSIGMLESLGTLDISGCSNLESLPKEMGILDSLTVLRAENVTGITRSPASIQNLKAWYSFIWLSPLKLKRNPEISWASSLPRSLVKLNLEYCNLSDDAFPTDLGNLSSLRELNLSNNPITILPDCIKDLSALEILKVNSCTRLRSLEVPQDLLDLRFWSCNSLEKTTLLSPALKKLPLLGYLEFLDFLSHITSTIQRGYSNGLSRNLVQFYSRYKLQPIADVGKEIIDNLGLFHLGYMRNLKVRLAVPYANWPKLSLQGCHEERVLSTYLPWSKVPGWFNLTNKGTSLSFAAPSHDSRIRGLSFCIVYAHSCVHNQMGGFFYLNTVITNTTKRLIWSQCPHISGIPEADEDMIWLSYWNFENQVEGGDEMNISVFARKGFQVKEVGVRL